MYLRMTQRLRKEGSPVRYVQVAHNRRVEGVTRAEVLLNLGREDQLDLDGLRRLAASITRFTDG
ncbi:MAG: IS1634 family transposase, partial [Solirubrobacteraceae bacterium]